MISKYQPTRVILTMLIAVGSVSAAEPATRPGTQPTTRPSLKPAIKPSWEALICPHETDPNSPRKSRLQSAVPAPGKADPDEVLRNDLDHDGRPDIIEAWWHGKRVRWIGEGGQMQWTDLRGSMASDALQVDRDDDGYYDGPGDLNVKWADDDGDGVPDVELISGNPQANADPSYGVYNVFMVFVDDDHDGVLAYIDPTNWEFGKTCWRVSPTSRPTRPQNDPNFSCDYNGNSTFLKQHHAAWLCSDQRYSWENPFLFYDTDGCTEMSIRLIDIPVNEPGAWPQAPAFHYRHLVNEAFVSYDLDNNSQLHNEMDYDMTLRFGSAADGSRGERIDYSKEHHPHPAVKAPQWVIDAHLFRFDNWRKIDEFIYLGHDKAYEQIFKPKWSECYMTFDEDNDDHRWERVELYYPTEDYYSTKRSDKNQKGGLAAHPQSDTLGDRAEWDVDDSGRGQIYIGSWDRKMHLFGAEKGAWTIDRHERFWGSSPVLGDSSPDKASRVESLVIYEDTDGNGFFDRITYDDDGDGKPDLVIDLLDYKTDANPHPDVQPLLNPAELKWQGMHETFSKLARDSFRDAGRIYRATVKKGMNTPELDELSFAASTWEQYDHGYWLRQEVFRTLDRQLATHPEQQRAVRNASCSTDVGEIVEAIETLNLRPEVNK